MLKWFMQLCVNISMQLGNIKLFDACQQSASALHSTRPNQRYLSLLIDKLTGSSPSSSLTCIFYCYVFVYVVALKCDMLMLSVMKSLRLADQFVATDVDEECIIHTLYFCEK